MKINDTELNKAYSGKTVFVTGHTGFKGAWLALMLRYLGAKVIGYALPPLTSPNLFDLVQLNKEIVHIEGDICDYSFLRNAISEHQPDILFHLAAQPIVLEGYENPKLTFDVNSGGTVNVLEALREIQKTQACLIITTDKCYENNHWSWGYRENDTLGGKDPYSASKTMAEIAVEAYRSSFFTSKEDDKLFLATARAGNILGGGDFSPFRIIPDCIRALSKGSPIQVRNPKSARPWLYVLDALAGYLHLGARLMNGERDKADAWNFGPKEVCGVTVQELVERCIALWDSGEWEDLSDSNSAKEMPFLRLNWDKAANLLNWKPQYCWEMALNETLQWYATYHDGKEMRSFCIQQIEKFVQNEKLTDRKLQKTLQSA